MNDSSMTPPTQMMAWSHIIASGSQAEVFLQGQLTQDVAPVDERGTWSLVLAPDSVVIASCLVRRADTAVVLVVERELAEGVHRRLARFLLRTDCQLTVIDVESGPFADAAQRVARGWPGAPEFAAGLTPHSFGDSFVRSTISFTKGCFTGQELVGRLDARGSSVPWRLVRASGPDRDHVNAVLCSKGPAGPQGLTTVVHVTDGVTGLGFAHRSLLAGGSEAIHLADGVIVEPIG